MSNTYYWTDMSSEELWDIFEEAYLKCSQARPLDGDQYELNQYMTYGEVKENKAHTLQYWTNPTTIGGRIIWDNGYFMTLPLELVEDIGKIHKLQKELW